VNGVEVVNLSSRYPLIQKKGAGAWRDVLGVRQNPGSYAVRGLHHVVDDVGPAILPQPKRTELGRPFFQVLVEALMPILVLHAEPTHLRGLKIAPLARTECELHPLCLARFQPPSEVHIARQ